MLPDVAEELWGEFMLGHLCEPNWPQERFKRRELVRERDWQREEEWEKQDITGFRDEKGK